MPCYTHRTLEKGIYQRIRHTGGLRVYGLVVYGEYMRFSFSAMEV